MLLYLALGRKAVLLGLFQTDKKYERIYRFMSRDFTQPKHQAKAVNNAFSALSKQKFQLAAAFFLLGGSLRDAVTVCVRQLRDPQLALVVAVLVEGPRSPLYRQVLEEEVLPQARGSHDRWLEHIALTLLGRADAAVRTLVRDLEAPTQSTVAVSPCIASFLRVLRQRAAVDPRAPPVRTVTD